MTQAIQQKKSELDDAKRELSTWKQYDAIREDGSGAQDRRHEERGQYLQDRVQCISQELRALEAAQPKE